MTGRDPDDAEGAFLQHAGETALALSDGQLLSRLVSLRAQRSRQYCYTPLIIKLEARAGIGPFSSRLRA